MGGDGVVVRVGGLEHAEELVGECWMRVGGGDRGVDDGGSFGFGGFGEMGFMGWGGQRGVWCGVVWCGFVGKLKLEGG